MFVTVCVSSDHFQLFYKFLNSTQLNTCKADRTEKVIYTANCKLCRYVLITVQRDTTQSSLFIILQVHFTCFGRQPHPSSGVHKTLTTTFSTGNIFCTATSLQRGQREYTKL